MIHLWHEITAIRLQLIDRFRETLVLFIIIIIILFYFIIIIFSVLEYCSPTFALAQPVYKPVV